MDAMKAILTRRSVRSYKKEQVPDAVIKKLLNAAVSSPSAGNQQPWHFIVISDHSILEKISEVHPYAKMMKEADKAIVVCGDPESERFKNYWPIDCAAATENILIAVRALNLGACWLGVYPREERMKDIRKLLGMPKEIFPFCLISIGKPDEKQKKVKRDYKNKLHINKW